MIVADDATSLATIAERIGIPAVILVVVFYFSYKAFQWAALHIVQPLITAHTDLLAMVRESNATNTKTNEINSVAINKLTDAEVVKLANLAKVSESTEQTQRLMRGNNTRLDCLCEQTADQTKQIYELVKLLCSKEGLPVPEPPPKHPPCQED